MPRPLSTHPHPAVGQQGHRRSCRSVPGRAPRRPSCRRPRTPGGAGRARRWSRCTCRAACGRRPDPRGPGCLRRRRTRPGHSCSSSGVRWLRHGRTLRAVWSNGLRQSVRAQTAAGGAEGRLSLPSGAPQNRLRRALGARWRRDHGLLVTPPTRSGVRLSRRCPGGLGPSPGSGPCSSSGRPGPTTVTRVTVPSPRSAFSRATRVGASSRTWVAHAVDSARTVSTPSRHPSGRQWAARLRRRRPGPTCPPRRRPRPRWPPLVARPGRPPGARSAAGLGRRDRTPDRGSGIRRERRGRARTAGPPARAPVRARARSSRARSDPAPPGSSTDGAPSGCSGM